LLKEDYLLYLLAGSAAGASIFTVIHSKLFAGSSHTAQMACGSAAGWVLF